MKEPTLRQGKAWNQLVEDQGLSCNELQSVYDSGAMSRIFIAAKLGTLKDVNRAELDRALGLFSVKEAFLANAEERKVRLVTDSDFKRFFASSTVPISKRLLRSFIVRPNLRKSSDYVSVQDVIKRIGGENAVEVTLSDAWNLLILQPNGEDGELLTNHHETNAFFVKHNDYLYEIYMFWDRSPGGNFWDIRASVPTGAVTGVYKYFYPTSLSIRPSVN